MAADSKAEDRMNLAALQQCDPYITGIVQTASQVALYTFNAEGNEWEKTDIEGSLFVYARSATPYNGFMIMNRLSMNNLTEPVTKELEFQLQDPFLLYKTAQSIFGLWFYDKTECLQVSRLMESLVHKAKKRAKGTGHRSRSVSESGAVLPAVGQMPQQVDIMEMLSRAQQNQQGDAGSDPPPKSKSPPVIASGSPTVLRPVPVKAEDSSTEQTTNQNTAEQPVTNKVVGQMSQGPPTHPGFNRSISMQGSLSYLSGSPTQSGKAPQGKVNDILQKLLANPGEVTGVVQHSLDHPLSNRQIQTVESLERRQGQKHALEKKATDLGSGQGSSGSGQGSSGSGQGSTMRTVQSIEKQHADASVADSAEQVHGYQIQNLLAQLNIAQQTKPTGQHESTEGGNIITHPLSQGGPSQLPALSNRQQYAPATGQQPVRTSTNEAKDQSDSDINQKLLTNLAARAAAQITQPQSSMAPLQLIQPSSIRPNLPIKPHDSGVQVKFHGNQQVPSLQQLASGGKPGGQRNPVPSTQTATNGAKTCVPTSPQRIPGSLLPPTLLTPQAFRKRSASETVTGNPSQLFHTVKDNVVVQPRPPTNQRIGGSTVTVGHHVDSSRHSPLLNRVEPAGRVNTAEALNKEQFKQAFVHLLQNDSNFLGSLHSAYLQSLRQPPM